MNTKPFHQNCSFRRMCLVLIIPLLLTAFAVQKTAAQATVSNFQFKQYDRYDANGNLLFANSSLGSVSFSPVNQTVQTQYLNIYAQRQTGGNAWLVQNYPIIATDLICQSVDIDYKYLDIMPGWPVNYINYSYTLTPTLVTPIADTIIILHDTIKVQDNIRPVQSSNAVTNNVYFQSFDQLKTESGIGLSPAPLSFAAVTKDEYQNEASGAYWEFGDYVLFKQMLAVADTIQHKDVPEVEEDTMQCLPGSFARSIGWLIKEHKLNCTMTPQQIYDSLVKLFKTCWTQPDVYKCMVDKKADFLKSISNNKGKTDRVLPPADACAWLKDKLKTCDVELDINLPGRSHIVTVTGLITDGSNCCTIKYRDDDKQDKPGGDKCEKTTKVCGDSVEFKGKKYKIRYLISECIENGNNKIQTEVSGPATPPVTLLQNSPNPFGTTTTIGIRVQEGTKLGNAQLIIRNSHGNEVQRIRLNLQPGLNNIPYTPGRDAKGLLYYSLQVDGQTIATRQMMTELREPQPKP